MKKFVKFVSFTFSIIALSICACNEPTLVGEEIIPETDGVNSEFIDTLTVNLKTVEEDRIRTDELSVLLIGGMESQTFGNVYADFYSQVRIPSNNLDFGENSVPLGIYLNLDYSAVFGDSMRAQTFSVYQLEESISIENDYYDNDFPVYDSLKVLGTFDTIHNFVDTVTNFGNKLSPRLQIELDISLAESFLNANDSVFANNDSFLEFFKGFYIKYDETNSEDGLMIIYNLLSSASNITMYYATKDSGGVNNDDTLSQTFVINANAENAANYRTDFSTAAVNNAIDMEGQAELYVQNLSSYFIEMELPYLQSLKEIGDVVINQAKISFVRLAEENTDSIFPPPIGFSFQYIDPKDSLGDLVIIDDATTSAYDYGGDLESFTAPDGTELEKYEFNCTIFLNEILKGRIENPQMFIVPLARRNAPFRTRIAGSTHPDYPTKINIIYSVIN